MSASNKRIRTAVDEEQAPAVSSAIPKLYQLSLLACDPKEIAALGRHDDEMMSKLKAFKSELDSELDKVEKARQTDEAIKRRDMMHQQMKSKKGCMGCKSNIEGSDLKLCAELNTVPLWKSMNEITNNAESHCRPGWGNSNPIDSILCESCLDTKKDELKNCKVCGHFLCQNCMSYAKQCGKLGGGCGEYYCHFCYIDSKEGYYNCDSCENWFCSSCMEGSKRRRICEGNGGACNKVDKVCVICEEKQEYCDECHYEFEGGQRRWEVDSEESDYYY